MTPLQMLAAVAALSAGLVAAGAQRAARASRGLYPPPLAVDMAEVVPSHDGSRLTAAVLLDHAGAEVSDFLLPYELLAASGSFNVHAVAPEHRPAPLTGGLDVMPHVSIDAFGTLPVARADLVVVGHLPAPDPRLIDWLRSQASSGATVLSICTGAAVTAAAGLVDGRRATAHWGDFGRLERRYPEVTWVRGVRYVDDGDVVASAGITSGIDATLHVIRRLAGAGAMHRAAEVLGYGDLSYLDDPTAEQHRLGLADAILPLVAAFGRRRTIGVLLDDGVDEAALAAVMDTYAATFTARTLTMTPGGGPVRTRHGLTVFPRADADAAPALDRLLAPGTPPRPYAAFEVALREIGQLGGHRIARFAAKRLEHRPPRPGPAARPS